MGNKTERQNKKQEREKKGKLVPTHETHEKRRNDKSEERGSTDAEAKISKDKSACEKVFTIMRVYAHTHVSLRISIISN